MSETQPETQPETAVETVQEQAPELTDPIGAHGASLMGLAPWPVPEAPATAPEPVSAPATSAELRAQAEKLLAEADAMDKPAML